MCYVSTTELRNNISHYLELSKSEDIYVTKNNEVIAVISNPKDKAYATFLSHYGCMANIDSGEEYKDMVGEEIMKKCGF